MEKSSSYKKSSTTPTKMNRYRYRLSLFKGGYGVLWLIDIRTNATYEPRIWREYEREGADRPFFFYIDLFFRDDEDLPSMEETSKQVNQLMRAFNVEFVTGPSDSTAKCQWRPISASKRAASLLHPQNGEDSSAGR